MNLTQITCPYCHSEMIKTIKSYETKHNSTRHLHKCKQCTGQTHQKNYLTNMLNYTIQ